MRVFIALAFLAVCLSLGGCSRPSKTAYATPLPIPRPQTTETVKPRQLPVKKTSAPATVSTVKSAKVSPVKQSSPVRAEKIPAPSKTSELKLPPLPVSKPPQTADSTVHRAANAQAKFKAAQEKAKLSGVQTLTQEDIEGLSHEQIKELRGY
jgi:hypothetical protein